jgi:transposase-like protein
MNKSHRFPRRRVARTDATRRARLLSAFDRSGLSAAAFARQHGLNYTTFCGWRQRRGKVKASPEFVQVEAPTPTATAELTIELHGHARLCIHSASQIELAARLLHALNPLPPC